MYEISIKKTFLYLLKKLVKPKVKVNHAQVPDLPILESSEIPLCFDKFVFKALKQPIIVWQQKNLTDNVKINSGESLFKIKTPLIKLTPAINTIIRWRNSELNFQVIQRNYPVNFFTKLNTLHREDLIINKVFKSKSIDRNIIELDRRLRVTEEIVEITPYVRCEKSSKLLKIPIIKKPLYKFYFSQAQVNYLKELLASQNKVSNINIEIISVYDKFSVENFSSIKQDNTSKNLICYLSPKQKDLNEDKMYYLVIGKKINIGKALKSIVKTKLINDMMTTANDD